MSFKETLEQDRRLHILRFLTSDNDYSLSDILLQSALQSVAHTVSTERINTDFDWLKEQGYIDVNTQGTLKIATITQRGIDVVLGRTKASGIRQPTLSEITEAKDFQGGR